MAERTLWFCLTFLSGIGLIHGVTRTYYIGIQEEYWDYAPSGKNVINGLDINEDEDSKVLNSNGAITTPGHSTDRPQIKIYSGVYE